MENGDDAETEPGPQWRAGLAIGLGLGWLMTVIFWWTMWSEGFSEPQKLAIALLSLLVVGGLGGSIWLRWSMAQGMTAPGSVWRLRGFGTRVAVSTAVLVGAIVVAVWWLFFEAVDYTICQSFIVIIVVLVVMAAMLGLMWVRWSNRTQRMAEAVKKMHDTAVVAHQEDDEDEG
jgi:membrane protein YdbS with pleckstrin-like domain